MQTEHISVMLWGRTLCVLSCNYHGMDNRLHIIEHSNWQINYAYTICIFIVLQVYHPDKDILDAASDLANSVNGENSSLSVAIANNDHQAARGAMYAFISIANVPVTWVSP